MSETNFLLEALEEFQRKVVEAAKSNLAKKNASGNLSKSIKGDMQVMPNSIRLFFEMEAYGWFQDEGVKGKDPGALPKPGAKSKDGKTTLKGSKWYGKQKAPNSQFRFGTGSGAKGGLTRGLDKWIVRRGIAPRTKSGQFMSRKTLKFLMARSIYLSGIKPTMFFTKPFEKAYKELPNELIEKYGLDMENLLVSIIDESLKNK